MVNLFVVGVGLLQMIVGWHWLAFAMVALCAISDGIKEIDRP